MSTMVMMMMMMMREDNNKNERTDIMASDDVWANLFGRTRESSSSSAGEPQGVPTGGQTTEARLDES
jgi:hypothetical protein